MRAKRCALYVRVSTERQAGGNSLGTQKAQLLQYAKARGYEVADLYTDVGLSGKNTKRPELQRMLSEAREGRFEIVVVAKVDRISRSMRDLLEMIAVLREHGVEFASVGQQFDTSEPMGRLTLHILGSFAQFERELLVERTRGGHLHRLRKSDWSCGPVPFGYRKVDGKLVEVPQEAKVVQRIFSLFLNLKSRRGLALALNEEGVLTRRGKCWTSNTVTAILINPVYTGANVYGRRANGDFALKERCAWVVIPGVRKPLVDQETFEAVQELLARGSRKRKKAQAEEYLLSGLLRCGVCGSAMCGSAKRKGGKLYRYYKCSGSQHRGKAVCSGTSVGAERLEASLLAEVQEVAAKHLRSY